MIFVYIQVSRKAYYFLTVNLILNEALFFEKADFFLN